MTQEIEGKGRMIFEQYYLDCLSHASYLIGDEETGSAVIVDPRRDVDQYLEAAARLGLEIRDVILTHCHADFVAGHIELAQRVGARIHMGARAEADFPFHPAGDGHTLQYGQVRLRVLETPGHTPESISVLVYDLRKSDGEPHAILTGDALFVGDVGRPDLLASSGVTAEELAGLLYDSLHEKILPLPDGTLVYPAHGAGSMCGKNLSSETFSTLGEQRRTNYALQPMEKDEFIRLVSSGQPDAPQYFRFDADLNRRHRPTLEESLQGSLRPLSVDEVVRRLNGGAAVLDVREPADFASGHLPGAVNISLDGRFASWVGTILEPGTPIVLVADPEKEREAAMRLGRIGYDGVVGYLEGGTREVAGRKDLMESHDRLRPEQLASVLASETPPVLLDVRNPEEWEGQRIEGSLNIPLNHLEERVGEIPRGREVLAYCETGYRSSLAVSLLERQGWKNAGDLVGGILAWVKEKRPTTGSARAAS